MLNLGFVLIGFIGEMNVVILMIVMIRVKKVDELEIC